MNKNEIIESLREIQLQINSTLDDKPKVTLLAVSKNQSSEKIRWAYEGGQREFGENYVQEALKKMKELEDLQLCWHFIGKLQRNKVKDVVGKFELIHSIDSFELAQKVSQKAQEMKVHQKILLEVNLGEEKTKGGFDKKILKSQYCDLIKLPNILFCGLMVLPPPLNSTNLVRPYFKELHDLFYELKFKLLSESNCDWTQLSMGTSLDFKIAIEEGSTIIRIGTAIFGERK